MVFLPTKKPPKPDVDADDNDDGADDDTIELTRRPAFIIETERDVDEAATTQLYMRIPDLVALLPKASA